MPWTLDIHTFDVGVGEASLLVVSYPTPATVVKSILIDCGLGVCAETVHNAVKDIIDGASVDAVLVTHYDDDHSAGVANLLYADNLSVLCAEVASSLSFAVADMDAQDAFPVPVIAAKVAFGVYRMLEGFDDPDTDAVGSADVAGMDRHQAVSWALDKAATDVRRNPDGSVVPEVSRRLAARKVAHKVARLFLKNPDELPRFEAVKKLITDVLLTDLQSCVPVDAQFDTKGMYRTSKVYDVGGQGTAKDDYAKAVRGALKQSSPKAKVLVGLDRDRSIPMLGQEIFWNGRTNIAAHAPYAVVVSGPDPTHLPTGQVWQGVGTPPETIGSSANNVSIGLAIQFNSFTYFTAGDLPTKGEDLLADALCRENLPDGRGGTLPDLPSAPPVLAFKCSHHGAHGSTSSDFLASVTPVTATISCGASYQHPDQRVVDDLHNLPSMTYFMMTNCRYNRNHVPASPAHDGGPAPAAAAVPPQSVAGNKSRVCGDNDPNNFSYGRHRGDIALRVTEAETLNALAMRHYSLTYWENYPDPGHLAGQNVLDVTW